MIDTQPAAAPTPAPGMPPAAGGTPPPTPQGTTVVAPSKPSTTGALFPDFVDTDGNVHSRVVRPELTPQADPFTTAKPTPPEAAQPPAGTPPPAGQPAAPAPAPATPPADPNQPAPPVLSLEDLKGKMVRVKVDGVEQVIPAEQAVESFQVRSHLDAKLREVADREKKIGEIIQDALKGKPATPGAPATPPETPATNDDGTPVDPKVKALQDELAVTKARLAEIEPVVAPQRYQHGLSVIDQHVQTSLGRKDFMQYVPKIEAHIKGLLKDPAKPTPEEVKAYDNADFYFSTYQQLVIKELSGGTPPAPPTPPTPPPPAPPAAPPANMRGAPLVVEGSGGTPPAAVRQQETWETRYSRALEQAQKSGKSEDWQTVLDIKYEK